MSQVSWRIMEHGTNTCYKQPWNNHVTSIMDRVVMVNCHHVTIEHVNMSSKCHALCQAVLGPNSVWPKQNFQVCQFLMNLTWQSI